MLSARPGIRRLWIGSYPGADGPGTSEGIWAVDLEEATGVLDGLDRVVACVSPSFLALHPHTGVLFAVDEREEGHVSAFAPTTSESFTQIWTGPSGGTHPCHVVVEDDAAWVSNYGSGTFATARLTSDGVPTGEVDVFEHAGSGADPDRQSGPHVHSAGRTIDGGFAWVADLGTDEVWRYVTRVATAGDGPPVSADGIAVALPPGCGPRHMAFHHSGVVFVAGELDNSVNIVWVDEASGAGTVLGRVPACSTTAAVGAFPSHIALNASGTRLYVGVRGPDVIATFAVRVGTGEGVGPVPGADPLVTLEHLGDTPTGGEWPRHLAVLSAPADEDGNLLDRVVVANQNSSDLVVIDIDDAGQGSIRSRLDVPVPPACVLPD